MISLIIILIFLVLAIWSIIMGITQKRLDTKVREEILFSGTLSLILVIIEAMLLLH